MSAVQRRAPIANAFRPEPGRYEVAGIIEKEEPRRWQSLLQALRRILHAYERSLHVYGSTAHVYGRFLQL